MWIRYVMVGALLWLVAFVDLAIKCYMERKR
jgi:hypothetical protein